MALNPENQHPERTSTAVGPKKQAYCRCWQSKNFPFCDGSHRAYNEAHQDHLGPLIVEARAAD